jgi:diguanylate cyclase (GGDEF)-like protein
MEKNGFSKENRVRLRYIVADLCPPPQYHYMAGGEVGGYALLSLDKMLRFKLGRMELMPGVHGLWESFEHFILQEPETNLLGLIELLPLARGEAVDQEISRVSAFRGRSAAEKTIHQTIDIMNAFLQDIGSSARFDNNHILQRDPFETEEVGPRAKLPKLFELEEDLTSILADDKLVSIIVIDLDGFKAVNDRLGHNEGDICLDAVVDVIGETISLKGRLYRFREGDEFAVVLRNTTSGEARATAERIRASIEQRKLGGDVVVTVSVGVASSEHRHLKTAESLLKAADDVMYVSKFTTKNRVTTWPASDSARRQAEENRSKAQGR